MEDADKNSKSLVLITRVGSTPTTGIKKLPQLVWGVFFLSAARDDDLVVCIGRNCHAGLHHFQPVHEKIVEKYRGVIKAGVNFFDGADLQPIIGDGILQGIGQLLVPIKKLLYGRFLLLTLIAENVSRSRGVSAFKDSRFRSKYGMMTLPIS